MSNSLLQNNITQQRILDGILKSYTQQEMSVEDFGSMLQEIGVFLMWNSPDTINKKRVFKKVINRYIKPFIHIKKIEGGK